MSSAFRHHDLRGIYSAPIRLYWAGWETDTYKLQQAGWQLSVEQMVMNDAMRIFMKHDGMQMQAMTDQFGYSYRQAIEDFSGQYINSLNVPIQAMGKHITFHIHGRVDLNAHPVDCQPQLRTGEIKSMEDLVHFAPLLTRTNEIILPPSDVQGMLDAILKYQDPARQDYLKAQLREERAGMMTVPRQTVHAQIISIAA